RSAASRRRATIHPKPASGKHPSPAVRASGTCESTRRPPGGIPEAAPRPPSPESPAKPDREAQSPPAIRRLGAQPLRSASSSVLRAGVRERLAEFPRRAGAWNLASSLRFRSRTAPRNGPLASSAVCLRQSGDRDRQWREPGPRASPRSEEHTSELQSRFDLVCRLLLEKKKKIKNNNKHQQQQ